MLAIATALSCLPELVGKSLLQRKSDTFVAEHIETQFQLWWKCPPGWIALMASEGTVMAAERELLSMLFLSFETCV